MLKILIVGNGFVNFNREGAKDIYRISSFLAGVLYRDKVIQEDEIESCTYGIQITAANIVNFTIAFSIGSLTGTLTEMALFYGIFVSLRFFCGGYHAKSYIRCFSLFALTCLFYVVLLNVFLSSAGNTVWLLAAGDILLGICIYAKAPIEHRNRPFTAEERRRFRKRSVQLFLVWSAIGVILWIEQLERLSVGLIGTFFIIAGYMLVGKEKKR